MDIFGISKSIFTYIFWDKCMKIGSYVLGTKTKLLIEPNFDLGLRSGNIEFLNLMFSNFDDFWQGVCVLCVCVFVCVCVSIHFFYKTI